ncbi:ATP-binding protein [Sphingobacterium sp.]|uniref:hybrid sensor histidine kinase/response regulator transcription factor n=1 Tax=Sphingobacterium sp. TaxID=341027 RepID=UPI002897B9FA|nr:ATP-binding protein [Sphingobacterium sp.]
MQSFYFYCLFFYSLISGSVLGQSLEYPSFRNISLGTNANTVHSFAQDSLGMLWLGSNNGLFNYDSYSLQALTGSQSPFQTFVYCITLIDKKHFALGTGQGVLLYNYQADRFEPFPTGGPSDVRALLLVGDKLWIGAIAGLYCFDLKTRELIDYGSLFPKNKEKPAVYALDKVADRLLIGTYNGLFEFNPLRKDMVPLSLPDYKSGSNQFVNSIFSIPGSDKTYIGTEYGLYSYHVKNRSLQKAPVLQDHPIKAMASKDHNTLLVGTDDGLFSYQLQQQLVTRIKHDSRNRNSLANNIVWSIFKDRSENIWLGTDFGFSLWSNRKVEKILPIYQLTASSDGNRFYKIAKDSNGWYWLGGDNGLIRVRGLDDKNVESYWYRMGEKSYRLTHNRIRDIYQDRTGLVWIASDGGVNVFDAQTKQFKSFTINDASGRRNAKWAYDILEDEGDNLWIASYMGGIFVVNRSKLFKASGPIVADRNFSKADGLLEDFANQIVDNGKNKILALFYNKGISVIDGTTGKITELKDSLGHALDRATFMLKDKQHMVWVGKHGELRRIAPDGKSTVVRFDPVSKGEVTAMADVNDNIWVATNAGVWQINKQNLKAELIRYGQRISSMYYDNESEEVVLGGIDEVVLLPAKKEFSHDERSKKIVLTAMYVNNERFGHYDYGLRYRNAITLAHDQNNLRLEFSDLDYGNHLGYRLAYAFKGENETWIPMERGDNKVLLSNLNSGDYDLQLARVDIAGHVVSEIYTYHIQVRYPWYASFWAKSIYVLIAVLLLFWIINFFRVRNTLKWERRERRKVLELTKMKMDFLAAISHELKTPLSLILAPVSQLMRQAKNGDRKKQLEGVHRNALKISNLIQELMTFDQVEQHDMPLQGLLTSQIDLVPYIRQITEDWQSMPDYKNLTIHFVSDMERLIVQTDVAKLGSIINNLLANACKYNRPEGKVDVLLFRVENGAELRVQDTGIGIAADDLPYVFSKFYRSSSKEISAVQGTGVGLYLVKSYCEQLGWSIGIESSQEGTAVTVHLTLDSIVERVSTNERELSDKRKLLIVEDNAELADFLGNALHEIYDCRIVGDGREGLRLIDGHSFVPDIIITDAMMPNMGGIEMVKKLRQSTTTSTIPIILLTAQHNELIQRDWVSVGIDAYMTKPFDLEILQLQLQQLMDRKDKLVAQLRIDEIRKPTSPAPKQSPDEKFLAHVTKVIEDNMDDSEFSVQRLSEVMDLAAKQIYRKIKQLTGSTPVEYIRNIRIKKAALLLQQKKFTVAEVMYMVGFSNASYFSKCFQSEFGVTPKAYMERFL